MDKGIKMKYPIKKILLIIITLVLLIHHKSLAMKSKVVITEGAPKEYREKIGIRLTKIVNALGNEKFGIIKKYTTSSGFEDIKKIVEETECYNVNPLYERRLISVDLDKYEVRDIKVKVNMNKTRGNPFQYLVFTIDHNNKIEEARFAIERHHYQKVIKQGEKLQDFTRRQKILHFIEIFRTAYNRKDLEYLKKVYSEDALIIVGKVLKKKKNSSDMLEGSSLPEKRIKFIKRSKKEYIKNLEKVFQINSFVKVNFEKIEINQHPKIDDIYGVTLKQKWKSSTYSDVGYLFLMVDFINPKKPVIHVRSWQPEIFPDGSVVSLGYFELIE